MKHRETLKVSYMKQLKLTKKQRKEYVRQLVNEVPYQTEFTNIQRERLNLLTGWEYKRYKKIMNEYGEPCIYVIDRKEVQSWLKAIDGYYKENRQLLRIKQALRLEIADIMRELKKNATYCDSCGSTSYLTVDHKSVSFDDIAMLWIERTPNIRIGTKPDRVGNFLLDEDQRTEWKFIHDTALREDYQILCRSCNSKKH